MAINRFMIVAVVMGMCGCAAAPKTAAPDLVFLGTVQSIEAAPRPQARPNWVVTFRVDAVQVGTFSGTTFSFRIHSPVKSGLEQGKQYVVKATRTAGGYEVDPYQWVIGSRHGVATSAGVLVSSPSDLPHLVDRRVVLVGVVSSDTKCPYLLGVDMWELDEYRGQKMRVTGILRQSIITEADIRETERQLGGPFAHRGAGTFYHLDDMHYQPEL
jgi:hypothetical protein